jgi:electron transport complex protein RnfG
MNGPAKKNPLTFLSDGWLVILLGALFGVLLAGVHIGLADRIAENIRNATYSQIPKLAVGAVQERTVEHQYETDAGSRIVYQALNSDGTTVGWVIPAAGDGFADKIVLLAGLSPDGTEITGIYVLDQKETPGLGDYITDAERFRNQFDGKQTDEPLVVTKTGVTDDAHEIAALTGATVSSDAVTNIVNAAIAEVKPLLPELAAASAEAGPETATADEQPATAEGVTNE